MKKTLVLLHGALGAEADLYSLKDLLKNNFDVHTFNFSGHGGDESVDRDFTIEQFTNDLTTFLTIHNITSSGLFGYSMGGYVALNYALKTLIKIEKIFTLGTKLSWSTEFAAKQAKFLNPDIIEEKVPVFAKQLIHKHGNENWKVVVTKTAQMMNALGNNPLLHNETYKKITSSVMLTIGDKDDMVSPEESKEAANAMPDAIFKILSDTQHPIEKVNMEMLANEINAFF